MPPMPLKASGTWGVEHLGVTVAKASDGLVLVGVFFNTDG